MSDKKHDFSMFTTTALRETVERHECMMESLAEENIPLASEWLNQAKQELTMRLIAGDDYATNGTDAESK